MARVYISSTYEDLKKERQAAHRAIRRTEHDVAGMEKYGAKPIRDLDVCYEDLARCDLYVGILGWCIGSKPEGSERSYQQHEYDRAGKLEIPRLLYIAPPRDEWVAQGRMTDEDVKEIRAIRESIKEMAHQFRSLADLEKRVGIDVAQYASRDKPSTD